MGQKDLTRFLAGQRPQKSNIPMIDIQSTPQYLPQAFTVDLQSALDAYQDHWIQKSAANDRKMSFSEHCPVGFGKDNVDLDGFGLRYVEQFRQAATIAMARGEHLENKYIEGLVLVVRNDKLHRARHVSHAAIEELHASLDHWPFAEVQPCGESDRKCGSVFSDNDQFLCIVTTRSAAWIPLEEDLRSFTSKFLLVPDMAISGVHYGQEKSCNQITSPVSLSRPNRRWPFPTYFFVHCLERALDLYHAKEFSGDLQLMEYVVRVMAQDLNCRLVVAEALKSTTKSSKAVLSSKCKSLIENSIAWRIFANGYLDVDAQTSLVRSIIKLTVPESWNAEPPMDSKSGIEEAIDADCIYSRHGLSRLATNLLHILLNTFGAAEDLGCFYQRDSYRPVTRNHRILLDSVMIEALWSESAELESSKAVSMFLNCLDPRDSMRLLGLLVSKKFVRTYGTDSSSLGSYAKFVGDVADSLQETASFLDRGGEFEGFLQVPLISIVSSLYREPARMIKSFKGLNHLLGVLVGIATSVLKLKSQGRLQLTTEQDISKLQAELMNAKEAFQIATQSHLNHGSILGLEIESQLILLDILARQLV